MKAVTIHQPWAGLIAAGVKRVENRTWPTRHRGELAIHAGLSTASMRTAPTWVLEMLPAKTEKVWGFGAVVAVAQVADCLEVGEYRRRYGDDPFAEGPWCWVLGDVRPLAEPVRCRGGLSLWEWDESEVLV